MGWAWRIGRVRGIDIKIHATFALALIWGALVLGWAEPLGRLYGAFLTIVLFGNVLLHELGHAFAAQRYGVEVHDIIMLPIGGVARLNGMPEQPRRELVIAFAGPAVNLVLALLCLLVLIPVFLFGNRLDGRDLLLTMATEPSVINLVVFILAINVSLFVFNLIPAFPMDGGRMLRAFLALRLSYVRATGIAVWIGRGFALAFSLFGLLTGNVSLAFIGLFVFFGAGTEGQEVVLNDRLRRLTVEQAVERHAPQLSAELPAHLAFERLAHSPYSALAVVDDGGRLLGIVTRRTMERRWAEGRRGPVALFVESPSLAVECATPLDVARRRMAETQAAVVAVYCGGSFEGLLDFDSIGRVLALQRTGWFSRRIS